MRGRLKRKRRPGVKDELRRFIVERHLSGRDDGFGDEESLLERGIVDPAGVMELVAFVERRYAIRVEDRELLPENLDSLERLARFVAAKVFEEEQYAA